VNDTGDRGLLGIAVDGQYPTHPYLYVAFTHDIGLTQDSTDPMVSRIVRYTLGPGPQSQLSNPVVLLGSYEAGPCPSPSNTLDCLPSDSSTHSIGTIRSAPDGTLFVGSGDGAEFNFVDNQALRSLNTQSLAGKILHVDRNGNGLPGHPFCPADANLTHSCAKVWAQGFRNPFRFTLREDGLLAVGDVGWTRYEELDLVGGGESYGWPCWEGPEQTQGYKDLAFCQTLYASSPQTPPDWSYFRGGAEGAIIGGPLYEEGPYPDEYDGAMFVGDYAQGRISAVKLQGGSAAVTLLRTDVGFTDLELHPSGDLAYVDPGFTPGGGGVYRVIFDPAGRPNAVATADPIFADPRETVSFSSAGSTKPAGAPNLTYEWDFGDGATSTAPNPTHDYAADGVYVARLTVTSGTKTDTDTVTVHPGNAAPPDQLVVNASPTRYRGGQTLTLTGSAEDEGAALPAADLDWTVLVRHGGHIHPVRSWLGADQVSFTVPGDHDADSHYEVILTATDSQGASTSKTFVVLPQTTQLALRSVPPGAPISYAGALFTAPANLTAAIGFRTTISAPSSFVTGGNRYAFSSWSDGGARLHGIQIPAAGATLTANYADTGPVTPPVTPDTKRPRLGFSARRGVDVRHGVIKGTVRDASRVRRVQIALARRSGSKCRWWSRRAKRVGKRASCARPRWITARLTKSGSGYRWRVKLGRRLAPGGWRLKLRAGDAAGNTAVKTYRLVVGPRRAKLG
jgi:PKD repeat protein